MFHLPLSSTGECVARVIPAKSACGGSSRGITQIGVKAMLVSKSPLTPLWQRGELRGINSKSPPFVKASGSESLRLGEGIKGDFPIYKREDFLLLFSTCHQPDLSTSPLCKGGTKGGFPPFVTGDFEAGTIYQGFSVQDYLLFFFFLTPDT